MKAAVYFTNKDVRVEDRPKPEPKDGEILVKTKACGVCGTDTLEWYNKTKAPVILGHEPTGVVAEVGPNVTKFKAGDRVFAHHHVSCMVCEYCRAGNYTMCKTFSETRLHPGGFSEYFLVPAQNVEKDTLLLPDHVSFEAATLVEPLACVVHAIRRANVQPGDSVALIGTGSMGLMFIEALQHYYGVRDLVVYELLDWRIEKAKEFGAKQVLVPNKDPKIEAERLRKLLNSGGADKVFTTGTGLSAMKLGMELVNKGGTLMFFAPPRPDEIMELDGYRIFFNELTVTGTYSADYVDTRIALDLIANGDISAEKLISHRYPLEKLSDAILQTASRNESLKCVIEFE